jgi:cell wall-associated NlpC family hydrolase
MAVIALLSMAMPRAGANQLSDERANEQAKASALAAQIAALGQREDALGEQYDAAVATLDAANRRVAAAAHSLVVAKADQAKTLALLRQDAVETYVGGGQFALGSSSTLTTMNDALLSQELEQTFASDQTSALDGYRESQVYEGLARAQLVAARDADARQLARLDKDRNQVQAAADQLVALEQQVKGKIATIIAQIHAEQLAAERRAEAARLAALRAEEAAQAARLAALQRAQEKAQAALRAQQLREEAVQKAEAAASAAQDPAQPAAQVNTASVGDVPTPVTVPQAVPGVSEAAAIAVQAAESRVGDPYVWGAAGPDYFDCSGLVMWAYAQAGVYLPHYSGAQYGDTIHIPMSDLEPGDLVFPADPGEHVAMYVGNGDIVQAPYTGADVEIVPLDPSFLVLASRVG